MSPHGEQQVEQEQLTKPVKFQMETPDDVVDTAGKIWMIPNQENQRRRMERQQGNAKELIETRIKMGADMDEYRSHLLGQMGELLELREDLDAEKQVTLKRENIMQTRDLENQLKAMATFDAREKILAQLASGANVSYLLKRGKEIQSDLETKMEEVDDKDVELFAAKEVLPHQMYMHALKELEQKPDSLSEMREAQRALLDARLKITGGIGGTHETEFTQKKPTQSTQEKPKENPEERAQMLLEKKWTVLAQELKDTEKELASLGFLQRLFGEKGKFFKMRLARIKADQERVYRQILPARQIKLGEEFEQMARAMRKE